MFNVCNLHKLLKINQLRILLLQNVQQLLQNVQPTITECTTNYYKMYNRLLQNVQ